MQAPRLLLKVVSLVTGWDAHGRRAAGNPDTLTGGRGPWRMSRFSAYVGSVSRGLMVGAEWKVEEQHPENLELQEKGPSAHGNR